VRLRHYYCHTCRCAGQRPQRGDVEHQTLGGIELQMLGCVHREPRHSIRVARKVDRLQVREVSQNAGCLQESGVIRNPCGSGSDAMSIEFRGPGVSTNVGPRPRIS
jgi:hypothetical protein